MAQRRTISRNLGSSRKFHAVNARCGKLGDFAQALFPLIVVNADDFGRLEGDAFTVKHKVFPVSPRTEEDFETALQAMNAVGLIRFYEVGGDRYLEVVNFDREQPGLHKRTKSDYPNPLEDLGKFPEIPKTSRRFPELPRAPGKFIDQFTRAVIKAQETPFLCGEGDRGWKADFDWLIANDRNVIRVLEGRYDSGARASPGNGGATVFDKIRKEREERNHGSDRVA